MIIDARKEGNVGRVKIVGDSDSLDSDRKFYRSLFELIDCDRVELDLSEMGYANSMLMNILVKFRKKSGLGTGQIILINPTENVEEILSILGADQIFTILKTDLSLAVK